MKEGAQVSLGADSEEKREPVSDIDTAVVDSLKVLDLKWPIREADIKRWLPDIHFVSIACAEALRGKPIASEDPCGLLTFAPPRSSSEEYRVSAARRWHSPNPH